MTQFRKTGEKTVTLGFRLDMVFHQIRLGLFFMDHDLIKRNLEKAQRLVFVTLITLLNLSATLSGFHLQNPPSTLFSNQIVDVVPFSV